MHTRQLPKKLSPMSLTSKRRSLNDPSHTPTARSGSDASCHEPPLDTSYLFPEGSAFDRWMYFLSHLATRPTKPMTVIPKIVEEPRAAHLLPLVPGRSVEDIQKDDSIQFGHRLFKRDVTKTRRKMKAEPQDDLGVPDPLIAALFVDSDTSSCSSDENYIHFVAFSVKSQSPSV